MDLRQHLRLMADWNVWCYQRTWAIVDKVPDADYRRDCGLFFKSIHRSMNHMLLVELMWRGRLSGNLLKLSGLDQELETDRAALKVRQLESAGNWKPYVDSLSDADLYGDFHYRALAGTEHALPRSAVIHTMFTHGCHHRGQVSTALTQLGFEAPVLDYPYFLNELPREALRKP
jgi:uncharacterized damage-inducible protein DinB